MIMSQLQLQNATEVVLSQEKVIVLAPQSLLVLPALLAPVVVACQGLSLARHPAEVVVGVRLQQPPTEIVYLLDSKLIRHCLPQVCRFVWPMELGTSLSFLLGDYEYAESVFAGWFVG